MLEEIVNESSFRSDIKNIQQNIHNINVFHGWWESNYVDEPKTIALIHSELSEALEYIRHGNPPSDHIPEFSGVEEEMADVIIRVLDYCYAMNFDLVGALLSKIEFNRNRPMKHGGKNF